SSPWDSQSHNEPRWYESITKRFSTKNRSTKFKNAKQAVHDALTNHFGDKQLADKLVSGIARSNKGLSKAELREVLTRVQAKMLIDQDIQTLFRENHLQKINTIRPTIILDAWRNDEENAWRNDEENAWINDEEDITLRLVSNYAKVHQPKARIDAKSLLDLHETLGHLGNQPSPNRTEWRNAQRRAKDILNSGVDLSPRARTALNQFSKLNINRSSIENTEKKIEAALTALQRSAWNLVQNVLRCLRNDPQVASLIRLSESRDTVRQVPDKELHTFKLEKFLKTPDSRIGQAFRKFYQSQGKEESHLNHLIRVRAGLGQEVDQNESLQLSAQALLAQGVNWDSEPQRDRRASLRPKQTLALLAKGKQPGDLDMAHLHKTISIILQNKIEEFRLYASKNQWVDPPVMKPHHQQIPVKTVNHGSTVDKLSPKKKKIVFKQNLKNDNVDSDDDDDSDYDSNVEP
ncbi:MAG: hypothetical protein MI861_16040, partial [Pirellulales bacterium]|nr:hypothetical protein [Pirellulales bacterium]